MKHVSVNLLAAICGFSAVAIFITAFCLFAFLNPGFDVLGDHVSKLGATGQPFAIWWNVIGFGVVGAAIATFGWLFGVAIESRLAGVCFAVAGVGFSMAALPIDLADATSTLSKIHYASICVSLAGWCLGLAQLSSSRSLDVFGKLKNNYTIAAAAIPILCVGSNVSSEPVAHRFLLLIVFCWIAVCSFEMVLKFRHANSQQI